MLVKLSVVLVACEYEGGENDVSLSTINIGFLSLIFYLHISKISFCLVEYINFELVAVCGWSAKCMFYKFLVSS